MFASKKLEFEIMCAVPFFIILYMKLTFGEFLSVFIRKCNGEVFHDNLFNRIYCSVQLWKKNHSY